jgi:hypothetical protein
MVSLKNENLRFCFICGSGRSDQEHAILKVKVSLMYSHGQLNNYRYTMITDCQERVGLKFKVVKVCLVKVRAGSD